MTFIRNFSQVKEKVEPGEELLYNTYSLVQDPNLIVEVLAAIDGGSTQTRGSLALIEELGKYMKIVYDIFAIPSTSIAVLDNRVVNPVSEKLYDVMDSNITNLTSDKDALVRSVRLVRGTKGKNVDFTENRLGSSRQKTTDPTFYYNILDYLGYSVIRKFSGRIPKKVLVRGSISLPPDDMIEKNVQNFHSNLRSYVWEHVESGLKIEFEFLRIHQLTEPEAEVKAFYSLQGDEVPTATLHLNGGGRSTGAEILENGISIKGAQQTLDFGGTQLLDLVGSLYVNKNGGKTPSRDRLEEAIRSGFLKVGASLIDIVPIIKKAKDEMANRIFTDVVRLVFDQQTKVAITDLDCVSVSGRFFDSGDYNYSVADALEIKFKEVSPNTKFVRFDRSYITHGLLLDGMIELLSDEELARVSEEADAIALAEEEAAADAGGVTPTEEGVPSSTLPEHVEASTAQAESTAGVEQAAAGAEEPSKGSIDIDLSDSPGSVVN